MEHVSAFNFHYKGESLDFVDRGVSFAYCPCDIKGTPKFYYGVHHLGCASQAFYDILNSFNAGNSNKWFSTNVDKLLTKREIWEHSKERGRLFFDKYLAVDHDGHIPSNDYVKNVLKSLNGNPKDYAVVFNSGNRVVEIPFYEFLDKNMGNDRNVGNIEVPKRLKDIYDEVSARRSVVNDNKFPNNMTKAEFNWYMGK